MVRKVESDEARFWRRVDRDGPVPSNRPDLGPCWLWQGSDIRGYGQFSIGSRTDGTRGTVKAHRFAFALEGPIPDGLTLDHLCRTTLCVRRSHLEPVTSAVNTSRGDTAATRNRAKTHCPNGHPFTGRAGHSRICHACQAAAMRRYRAGRPRPPITDELRVRNRDYMRAHRARKRMHQEDRQPGA